MKETHKRRLWIPAAMMIAAVLVAVSTLKPQNLAGVSAAEADSAEVSTVTVDSGTEITPAANQTEETPDANTEETPADKAEETPDANAEETPADDGQDSSAEPTPNANEGEDAAPADIKNYPVATFTVTDAHMRISLNNGAVGYLGFGDEEGVVKIDDKDIAVPNSAVTLYSKDQITALSVYGAMTKADVSKLTDLTALNLSQNGLSQLDVSKNTKLESLYVSDNGLKELNLAQNTALINLDCSMNALTALDVSKNTALQDLRCVGNQLKTLEVSKNAALRVLEAADNQLTKLDASANSKLEYLNVSNNKMTTFDALKTTGSIKKENIGGYQEISLPETVKAGEKLDLSAYKEYNKKKSYYDAFYYKESEDGEYTDGSVVADSDENLVLVFGNAYADTTISISIHNDNSPLVFYGSFTVTKNPNAPAAPEKAKGDVDVQDISGVIKSADAADKFDAHIVNYDYENEKYVLGDAIEKKDLRISMSRNGNTDPFIEPIAAFDKNFKKDSAKLYAYDISLNYEHVKLDGGIKLTLAYPNSIAKEWNKYDIKVYHFKDFDYGKLVKLDPAQVESIAATCDKDGIHITAPGFSNYVISVTSKNTSNGSPNTGETSGIIIVAIVLAVLSAACAGFVIIRRKSTAK